MKITINKKGLGILVALAMIFVTMLSAGSAVDITFNATNDANRWIRLGSNLIATYDPSTPDTINYYDSAGLNKSIDISPYTASRALKYGQTDPDNYGDIVFVCNYVDEELCTVDYSGEDVDIEDMSGVYQRFYDLIGSDPTGNVMNVAFVTDNLILFAVSTNNQFMWNRALTTELIGTATGGNSTNFGRINQSDSSSRPQVCREDNAGGSSFECTHTFYRATGAEYYIYIPFTINSIPKTSYVYRYKTTNAGTYLNWDNVTGGIEREGLSGDSTTEWMNWCYKEDNTDDVVCNMNTGLQAEKYDLDLPTEAPDRDYPSSPYNGDEVEIYFIDDNGDDHVVIINGTQSEVIVYESGVRQNTDANMTSYYSQNAFALANDVVIYPIATSTYRLTNNFTAPAPPIDNESEIYYNVTLEANNTYNESLFSLELLGGDEVLIGQLNGGDEYIYLYDYSIPSTLSEVDNVEVGDEIFKTSTYGNNVMVATDDGMFVYDLATLNEQEHDRFRFVWLANDAYDVATLSNTTAMVCDNNDEMDYYSIGSDPSGNLGAGCYDIEVDGQYAYVDVDDDGIRVYNISTPSTPSLITTIDDRTDTYVWTHGDLLDLNSTNQLLLAKRNLYSMILYDISSPSSPTEIVSCNNGGAGEISAVELINNQVAVGGTTNGRIVICDLTDPEETTNTDWFTLDGMNGESIQAIEYDGQYLHSIGNSTYVISSFSVDTINISGNTPPTLDNYTISDTELLLDQEVDITIIAGNVEPEDVIRYRLRCADNESYGENTNGEFTCSYSTAGTYNITMAVSDNYHVGSWYDEIIVQAVVLNTNFTGGTLRLLLLDDENQGINLVEVTADGQTLYTNSVGSVTFTTNTTGLYEVTAQKTGYYTTINSFEADGTIYPITMTRVGNGSTTLLRVTILDEDAIGIQDAIVSYTNTLTYEYDYTFTDGSGLAYFDDINAGIVIVQGSKGEYEANSESVVLIEGTINDVEITLKTLSDSFTGTARLDRECVDDGLWLCGNTAIVEHSCSIDADCELSNYCVKGVNKCSRFNYSQCDAIGMPRTQKCVTKLTTEKTLNNITNWMLSNLLWVIVMLILLVAVGMLFIAWKK